MVSGIDPRVDFAFKKVFGSESSKALTISLINAVLNPPPESRIVGLDWLYFFENGATLDAEALPERLDRPEQRAALGVLNMLIRSDSEREKYEARLRDRLEIETLEELRDEARRDYLTALEQLEEQKRALAEVVSEQDALQRRIEEAIRKAEAVRQEKEEAVRKAEADRQEKEEAIRKADEERRGHVEALRQREEEARSLDLALRERDLAARDEATRLREATVTQLKRELAERIRFCLRILKRPAPEFDELLNQGVDELRAEVDRREAELLKRFEIG